MKPILAIENEDRLDYAELVTIGKDVIELFTSGMYVSPITLYREYIQNSSDAIDAARTLCLLSPDEGLISIDIEHSTRSVTITDNGSGISSSSAVRLLLAIGGSTKKGKAARGFRGIGRLAGLAYCRTLEFRTKASGENVVTSVTWDCQGLRQRLSDPNFKGNLEDIISESVQVKFQTVKESTDKHFFEVCLRDVVRLRNDVLLNESLIASYLSQVGPAPFSPNFSLAPLIQQHISKWSDFVPTEIRVSGTAVFRPFLDKVLIPGRSEAVVINEIETVEFLDVDGEIGAIGWLGHHQYARSLPFEPGLRGLRAKVGNLQVGDESIFSDSFREPRFNSWCIGEIHILDRRVVPNARRDNFVLNHHYYNLLAQIGPLATRLSQHCRRASISRNAAQGARSAISGVIARLNQESDIESKELSALLSTLSRIKAKLPKILDSDLRQSLASELDSAEKLLADRTPTPNTILLRLEQVTDLVVKTVKNRAQVDKLLGELHRLS